MMPVEAISHAAVAGRSRMETRASFIAGASVARHRPLAAPSGNHNWPYRDTSQIGPANAATMRDQSPWSHHSRYRLYARSRLPYSFGISRHDKSVPTTASAVGREVAAVVSCKS